MRNGAGALRVALLAGTLERGGAEKQLVYMAAALRAAGVAVRVYTLRGGFYEGSLREMGVEPVHIGQRKSPALRLLALASALRRFDPHIVQAGHFYTNLYAALAAQALGALGVGALRGDAAAVVAANGRWGWSLLRAPRTLIANSQAGRRAAEARGVPPRAVHVVPNVIAVGPVRQRARAPWAAPGQIVAAVVANLCRAKRVDRFLDALAIARRSRPELVGVIAGGGPERAPLEARAGALGLLPEGVRFTGQCDDVRGLLLGADMLVLSSDHEGFPNVLLEAMEAALPVVTTRAGDAGVVIEDARNGFVADFEDVAGMAERMNQLAADPELRTRLGTAGRTRVRERYSPDLLAGWLLEAYRVAAKERRMPRLLETLAP